MGKSLIRKARTGVRKSGNRKRSARSTSGNLSRSLSHVDVEGQAQMVDIGNKPITQREAVAQGRITISRTALRAIRGGKVAKGNPLQAARLAGIMAAKRTAELIPLCHPLPVTHVSVKFSPLPKGYSISASVRTNAKTGVEMEALMAVSVAALTVYDMVKVLDRSVVISDICIVKKSGGQSGTYNARVKNGN